MEKYYQVRDDGSRKELSEDEIQALIDTGNTELLQTVVAVNDAGEQRRPYRFTDVRPPNFDDDGTVTI